MTFHGVLGMVSVWFKFTRSRLTLRFCITFFYYPTKLKKGASISSSLTLSSKYHSFQKTAFFYFCWFGNWSRYLRSVIVCPVYVCWKVWANGWVGAWLQENGKTALNNNNEMDVDRMTFPPPVCFPSYFLFVLICQFLLCSKSSFLMWQKSRFTATVCSTSCAACDMSKALVFTGLQVAWEYYKWEITKTAFLF